MSDDDDDTFFVIILPVTILIFVSIFTYLFVGYMRLKRHLLNSGQVISALPFLILPEEQPEIRSPDGQLPPPAYATISETECSNNNNINDVINYNHPSLNNFTLNRLEGQRQRGRSRAENNNRQDNNVSTTLTSVRGGGGMLISQAELQQSGPPSTEMMLERPPPVYSIEYSTEVPPSSTNDSSRRQRRKSNRPESIAMNDISPPPYTPASEVPGN